MTDVETLGKQMVNERLFVFLSHSYITQKASKICDSQVPLAVQVTHRKINILKYSILYKAFKTVNKYKK